MHIFLDWNSGSLPYLGTNKAMKRDKVHWFDWFWFISGYEIKLKRMRVGRLLIIPLPAGDNQPHLAFVMSRIDSRLGHACGITNPQNLLILLQERTQPLQRNQSPPGQKHGFYCDRHQRRQEEKEEGKKKGENVRSLDSLLLTSSALDEPLMHGCCTAQEYNLCPIINTFYPAAFHSTVLSFMSELLWLE